MVYTTMPGIVTDDNNASAYQVRYQDDCEQWTEKNLEAGNYTFFGSTIVKFVWGTKKKPVTKPTIHSSLITVNNAKFESQTSKFLSPVYGWK